MATLFRHSFAPMALPSTIWSSDSNGHRILFSLFSCSRHSFNIATLLSFPFPSSYTPFSSPITSTNTHRIGNRKRVPFCSSMGSLSALETLPLQYPPARRDDSVVDNYHGIPIPDPYRWLEDPDAEEVKEFVEKQANLSESLLQTCETREKLRGQIKKLFDHPRYETPFKRGDKYFYFHNTGLQAQRVLYVQEELEGKAEVLLDPNGMSEDGTVALNMISVSEDAKFLAYGLSSSGSDWVTIKVLRIEDRTSEPDSLSWVKFSSISWTHDSKGFFYSRYPAPKEGEQLDAGTETNINLNHEVYYHLLGTDQSQDILCWRDLENPKWMFEGQVSDDGKYVLLYIEENCDPVNKIYYCDLSELPHGLEGFRERNGMLPFTKLVDNFEAQYRVISNDDSQFIFLTNKDAPKYKLVQVDLKQPDVWIDLLPEAEKDVLKSAYAVNGNKLLVSYLSNVKYILQIRDMKTGQLLHHLPIDIGTVYGISGKRKDTEVFIGFTSFLTPGIIYRCNLATEVPEMKIFREIVVPGFDRTGFQVNQVFALSKDGTKIPMFIVCKKNIILDGSHPSLLYGYGGFNVSLTPSFSVSRIILIRNLGVVFSIANVRGGGEYGEEWHKAGSLSKKQNCFDDFISAAKYLVSAGYTQPRKLCIEGGSNGGLLVAACVNQVIQLTGHEMDGQQSHKSPLDNPIFTIIDLQIDYKSCLREVLGSKHPRHKKGHFPLFYSRRLRIGRFTYAPKISQRPDLFGCALAHVGVMDMLRFHKFTIGHAWTCDFGCSDKEEEFHWLIKYSPLHNVKRPWEKIGNGQCQYPSTMLLTADHDDRVVPLHSLKLLATMQYVLCTSLQNSPQTNPIIARIDCKSGHGAGRPTQKLIDEAADRYSFMAKMLGISWTG